MSLPTLEVLFAPSVVGADFGTRMVLDVSLLDTGTLGDGALFYDITNYARSISTSRGRRRALDRFGTGTCQITLDNRDRRFDPTNTASPYYNSTVGVSGVVPSVPVVVRATWNGVTYPVFRGFIDSWSFAYSDAGVGDATATIACSDAFKPLSAVIGGLPNSTAISSSGTTKIDVGVSGTVTSTGGGLGFQTVDYQIIYNEVPTNSQNVFVSNGTETTPIIGTAGDLPGARVHTDPRRHFVARQSAIHRHRQHPPFTAERHTDRPRDAPGDRLHRGRRPVCRGRRVDRVRRPVQPHFRHSGADQSGHIRHHDNGRQVVP
jgi:hypothetical protein